MSSHTKKKQCILVDNNIDDEKCQVGRHKTTDIFIAYINRRARRTLYMNDDTTLALSMADYSCRHIISNELSLRLYNDNIEHEALLFSFYKNDSKNVILIDRNK